MGEIPNSGLANNSYIPKMPGLPENSGVGGGIGSGVFTTGKGSVIKRDSVVFKADNNNAGGGGSSSNYRNNQAGIQNTLPSTSYNLNQ